MAQYHRGRATEYRVIDELKEQGYACVRAASSKGNWDVVAVSPDRVLLISCKRTSKADYARDTLTAETKRLTQIVVPPNAVQEIWVWLDDTGWYAKRRLPADTSHT